jgi:hypothetical protein
VNINEKVDFDEAALALGWRFNQEAYQKLKLKLKELAFNGLKKLFFLSLIIITISYRNQTGNH